MPAECRKRQLGRISEQAQDYIRHATEEDAQAVWDVLESLESGDQDAWDAVLQAPMLDSDRQFGRMIVLLPNGRDVLVWRDYVDYPQLYAVFYIGLANHYA